MWEHLRGCLKHKPKFKNTVLGGIQNQMRWVNCLGDIYVEIGFNGYIVGPRQREGPEQGVSRVTELVL